MQSDNVAALNNLAWIYAEKADKRGIEFGKKAFDLAPKNPAVMDTYGWSLIKAGDVNSGVNIVKEASVIAPHILEIKYHLAYGLAKQGNKRQAKAEVDRLLANSDFTMREEAKALLRELN